MRVVPVAVILPGLIVHVPLGNPFRVTLPVGVAQVGCVVPTTEGVATVPPVTVVLVVMPVQVF